MIAGITGLLAKALYESQDQIHVGHVHVLTLRHYVLHPEVAPS